MVKMRQMFLLKQDTVASPAVGEGIPARVEDQARARTIQKHMARHLHYIRLIPGLASASPAGLAWGTWRGRG